MTLFIYYIIYLSASSIYEIPLILSNLSLPCLCEVNVWGERVSGDFSSSKAKKKWRTTWTKTSAMWSLRTPPTRRCSVGGSSAGSWRILRGGSDSLLIWRNVPRRRRFVVLIRYYYLDLTEMANNTLKLVCELSLCMTLDFFLGLSLIYFYDGFEDTSSWFLFPLDAISLEWPIHFFTL